MSSSVYRSAYRNDISSYDFSDHLKIFFTQADIIQGAKIQK